MIAFSRLSFARAGRPLVEEADLKIHPGWRVGLVGANGAGKSSLFALLTGELQPEKGEFHMPPGWQIAQVSQETPALPDAALDFVLAGDRERCQLEAEIAAAEAADDGERIGLLHARYQDIGAYAARARAAEVLHGLGFADADFDKPVGEFSGGWRVRLNLARALACRADLLLLDEPTNHLDLDAVLWLESWLKNSRATLLLISHDRDFLDAVVDRILAIDACRLSLYSGGYSDYEKARAARLAGQQAAFVAQQRQIAHLQGFIDRFKAKATKARQAQSRIKALARLESVAAAHVDSPFSFAFAPPASLPDPLLVIQNGAAGYRGVPILRGLDLRLGPACRIGLLGPNGAGKSTLIKLLADEIPLLDGRRTSARTLRIGYFAQHQLEHLRPDESPLMHLQRQEPETPEQALRDYLGGFDFRGDMATRPVGPFSGGEKSRLALALVIRSRPNLLLLDEPTNHLDLEMREALCFALQDYEGGVVLVSHDRHLLRTAVDELWQVADGTARPFAGDLDDYAAWLGARRATPQTTASPASDQAEKQARQERRAAERAERQARLARRRAIEKEIIRLEEQLAAWNHEKTTLAARLAEPAFYVNTPRPESEALHRRAHQLDTDIETAENRWLELHGELEGLPEAD